MIEALFHEQPDMSVVNTLLAPLFEKQALAPGPLNITDLPERDWLAENRAAFPPRKIGRFWVCGIAGPRPSPVTSRWDKLRYWAAFALQEERKCRRPAGTIAVRA